MCHWLTDRLGRRLAARVIVTAAASLPVAIAGLAPSPTQAAEVPAAAASAADKLLLKAGGNYKRQLFKLAAEDYAEFLKDFPTHPEATSARFALGVCHYRLNQYEPAIEHLTKVAADEKFAQRDEALAVIGHSYLATQKYDPAVAAFDHLVTKFPQSKQAENAALSKAQALYLAAQAMGSWGGRTPPDPQIVAKKYAEAVAAAEDFLKRFAQSSERMSAKFILGLSQKAIDQNDAAATTLAALLKEDPKSRFALDATLVLGQALEATGKLDEAAQRFREMVATAPAARQPEAHYSLGNVLYKQEKFDDAAKEFTAVLGAGAEGPLVKPARLQLGLSQLAAGKTAEARKALAQAAKDDAANASAAKYGLAKCDIADKKYDAAVATLDELMKLQPPPANLPQIAFDRAFSLSQIAEDPKQQDKHAEAAKAFEAFVTANPKSPQAGEASYRQAYSLHKLGQYDASHGLCGKVAAATATPPEFVQAARELDAENLFLLSKFDEASKAYAALAGTAKDEDRKDRYAFRMGQCAYSLSDFAKTAELLEPLAKKPKIAADELLGRSGFLLGDALLQQAKDQPAKYAAAADAFGRYLASLKPNAGDKSDRQEAQYKQAYCLLRGARPSAAAPGTPEDARTLAAAKALLTSASAGPETSPWTTRAYFELGQLAYQAKPPRLDEAAAAFKKVTSANGGNPPEELGAPALYFLGWTDYDQKKYAPAATTWAEVVKRYGKSSVAPDAAFHRGVALREATETAKALEAFQAYEQAYPKGEHLARARHLMADCFTKLNRPADALKVLNTLAADKATASDTVLYDLAWAQKTNKDDAGAAKSYRRIIDEQSQSKLCAAARAELAELLVKENKHAEAVDLLEPVVALKDAEPKVRSLAMALLGTAYKGAGKADKAVAAFAAYAKEFPDDKFAADALFQAGDLAASKGQFSDAEKALAELVERFPNYPQASLAQLKLGEAQADAGHFEDALASHQAFLKKYAQDKFAFRAQFGVGWALQNLKKLDEARQAYAKVTASNNSETAARAQFQIGEAFLEEGNFEKALPALLAVEDVYAYPKWSARALLDAGRAFEQLKQPDQAKKQYETVASKYKEQTDEAKVAQERLKAMK